MCRSRFSRRLDYGPRFTGSLTYLPSSRELECDRDVRPRLEHRDGSRRDVCPRGRNESRALSAAKIRSPSVLYFRFIVLPFLSFEQDLEVMTHMLGISFDYLSSFLFIRTRKRI